LPGDPLPHYTFLPWARRGVAAQIDQADVLGVGAPALPKARATMSVAITVSTEPVAGQPALAPRPVQRVVSLVGPGDVRTLKPDAILRTAPVPGTVSATPGELAFVEFYDEDFPWRYTPAKATAGHRLRPWLALFVLQEGEFTVMARPGETSILVVDEPAAMPLVDETWAWAHVQVAGAIASADELDAFVAASPDHALSRLLSPRRLEPNRGYRAFVVPAFESGRLAGLGSADETVPAQRASWGDGQPLRFPVYHEWGFRTGEESDFETLARRPSALVVDQSFGSRPLDVSDPGAGLTAVSAATVGLEGALRPVGYTRTAFPDSPGATMASELQRLVDLSEDQRDEEPVHGDDPIVTPPAFGAAPVGMTRVGDAAAMAGEMSWFAELNQDPRNRAVAGLGAEIVRQRDEELMERAWRQVDELEAVNQRLREADLAMAAADRIFAKHVATSKPDRVLRITAGAHSTIVLGGLTSVRGEMDASRVPAAAQSPAFRRISRPQRRLVATIVGNDFARLQTGLVARLNADPDAPATSPTALRPVSTAPAAPEPPAGVPMEVVIDAASAAVAQLAAESMKPREQLLRIARAEATARLAGPGLVDVTSAADVAALRQSLRTRLDAAVPAPADPHSAAAVLRDGVEQIIAGIVALRVPDPGQAIVDVDPPAFTAQFGEGIDGKAYDGIIVAPIGSLLARTASTTDASTTQAFVAALGTLSAVSDDRPPPPRPSALRAPDELAHGIADLMRPRTAIPLRLLTVLGGVADLATAELARSRRLKPVLAYPRFDDPLFTSLRALGQDYVLPNISSLPPESIGIMEPNSRFIESLMAGASTEMGRELLWNSFPTDLRGTYFAKFWDARDAGMPDPPSDIVALDQWTGELGTHLAASGGVLVLVVRAELIVKFPNTILFAQKAAFVGTGASRTRTIDPAGAVHYPILRGHLDPDIELYGFGISADEARGTSTDPGFFFCFMERPGQARFGLDLATPPPMLATWDDLAWDHLTPAAASQVLVTANAALATTTAGLSAWGVTAAHMASILCQSPVMLARHATDMLPTGSPS
jgi:hypothetical protein